MEKRLSAAYQRQNWCNCRCSIEDADMRGNQAAQKTRHLWNRPSCSLTWRRACKPQKVVAWGRTHRVCSSVDQNRVRKFCSRNRLTLMFNYNWRYMRSRRTLSKVRHAFRTGAARHDGLMVALIWVTRVGFQVILKIKCHNIIERQEL